MSLDFYLESDPVEKECHCPDCGNVHKTMVSETLFETNITHNLNKMADEAGIYGCLWRPEENGITRAEQLILPLTEALEILEADPARFKKFDSPNGWGLYIHFVPFVREVLNACKEYPKARVSASR